MTTREFGHMVVLVRHGGAVDLAELSVIRAAVRGG